MTKLNLTEDRKRIIFEALAEWRETGVSTAPADFDAAEAAITSLYGAIGKHKPYFVRLSSPLGAELYINLLCKTWPELAKGDQLWDQLWDQLRDQLGDQLRGQLGGQLWDQLEGQLGGQLWDQLWDQLGGQLRGQLWDQLRDQLWDQLRDQLRGQLWDQLRGQLGGQLWGQLGGQLGDQLRGQLGGQLGGQLRGQLWDQLRDQLGGQLWGQLGGQELKFMDTWFWGAWDYYWMWLDGGRRVGAVYSERENAMLDAHISICRSIGWWYPFNDFVILTDRPEVIRRNGNGQLHNEHGQALQYRDGTGVFSWNGQRVPGEWITRPGSIGPKEALAWPNADQRAAAMEIAGMANVLKAAGAKVVDSHPNALIGDLVEVTHEAIGQRERFIVAHEKSDRTGRVFGIAVPPDTRTALQGQSRIQGLPEPVIATMTVRT